MDSFLFLFLTMPSVTGNTWNKIRKYSILAVLSFLFLNCNHKSEKITIQGYLPDVPDGKIYLAQANKWEINLDSTDVISGKFIFEITDDSSFSPMLVTITFPDSNSIFRKGILMFSNNKSNAFYLESGITEIKATGQKPDMLPTGGAIVYCNIKAGKQNTAYIKNSMSDFGWLGNTDSSKRKTRIAFFKTQIQKYPYSFFLFESIVNYRSQYSTEELKELKSLFTDDVKTSQLGKKTDDYLAKRKSPESAYNDISLLNSSQNRSKIFDDSAKLNVLIFWASWCAPCRAEIPDLKKMYGNYKNNDVNIISISIDEDVQNWKKAIEEEKMSWEQFIVEEKQKNFIDAIFDPSTIPLIIITDNQRMQLTRYVGFESDHMGGIDSFINNYLSQLAKRN